MNASNVTSAIAEACPVCCKVYIPSPNAVSPPPIAEISCPDHKNRNLPKPVPDLFITIARFHSTGGAEHLHHAHQTSAPGTEQPFHIGDEGQNA